MSNEYKADPNGTDAAAGASQPPTAAAPRAWLGFSTAVLVPALVLIDSLIAMTAGWRPSLRLDRIVFYSAVGLTAALVLSAALPAGRRFFGRKWPHLLLAVLTAAAGWTAAEIIVGARQRRIDAATYHRRPPGFTHVNEPNPKYVPGISGPSRYTINSAGVRGPEFPPREEVYRILCVGGSTTECHFLDDRETWTHQIGEYLNRTAGPRRFWSGSVGRDGYATVEHLRFVQCTDLTDQVDCLVFLVGVNDVAAGVAGVDSRRSDSDPAPLWTRSMLLRPLRDRRTHRMLVAENTDGSFMEPHRKRRREAAVCDELPDLEGPSAAYADRIRRIIEVCRSRGVRSVFLTQPVLCDKDLSQAHRDLLWTGELADGRFLSVERMREAVEMYNRTLIAVCAEAGVECVDLSSLHGRPEFFYDHCHFTEAGAAEVARIAAAHFLSRP